MPKIINTEFKYKTTICNHFLKGECKLGEKCRFAHGSKDKKTKKFKLFNDFDKIYDVDNVKNNQNKISNKKKILQFSKEKNNSNKKKINCNIYCENDNYFSKFKNTNNKLIEKSEDQNKIISLKDNINSNFTEVKNKHFENNKNVNLKLKGKYSIPSKLIENGNISKKIIFSNYIEEVRGKKKNFSKKDLIKYNLNENLGYKFSDEKNFSSESESDTDFKTFKIISENFPYYNNFIFDSDEGY